MMVKVFFVGKGKNAGRNPAIPGRNTMKKLSVYLKGYRRQTVLAPLFKLLEALMDLFVPIVVANLIDIGIRGNVPICGRRCLIMCRAFPIRNSIRWEPIR